MHFKQRLLGLFVAAPLVVSATFAPPGTSTNALYTIPETVVADLSQPLGPFDAKPGDVLLRGRILRTERAFVLGPVRVSIDKFEDALAEGDELTPVFAPIALKARLGGDGFYYCGRDQRGRSGLAAALLGGIGQRFEAIVRFCFIDTDHDHKLDQVFLAGAKEAELQKPVKIEPVAFRRDSNVQVDPRDEVVVRYRKHARGSNEIQVQVEVSHAGKLDKFDVINYGRFDATRLTTLLPRLEADPRDQPFPSYFTGLLGGALKVNGAESDGAAHFVRLRRMGPVLFRPIQIRVNYIYIYY